MLFQNKFVLYAHGQSITLSVNQQRSKLAQDIAGKMFVQANKFYLLMIKMNKRFLFQLLAVFSKRIRNYMYFLCVSTELEKHL